MLRVGNLQRSIDFYTQVLGMKLLRTSENPDYKYSLAFLGYGRNPEHAEILKLNRSTRYISTTPENYKGLESAARSAGLL